MIKDGKEYAIQMDGRIHHCALDVTMHFVGGKWKAIVLWYLRNDAKRFSELKRSIPDITEKMLSLQLRSLENDGIVGRTIYPEVPPRVEYFLTPKGKTLIPMLNAMASWGRTQSEKHGELLEVLRDRSGKKIIGVETKAASRKRGKLARR
jgi:DNA-binding HxlR family transcriptional regulator